MASNYKVALIQLHPKKVNPELNFQTAAAFIRSAAQQGATLAVLPEYHLTNWVPEDPLFLHACSQSNIYLRRYKSLALECKINIVPGTIVEAHADAQTKEDKLVNVAYFISSDGTILGRYEKKNLWHPERPHLTSSTISPHEVIQTPIGPVGLLICWDLAFPEAFRELIAAGAKTIIVPTFWTLADCSPYGLSVNPRAEALFLESMVTARAYENTCAVIFVNAGGRATLRDGEADGLSPKNGVAGPASDTKASNSHYAGLSRVALPFVGALGDETKNSASEGMSIVDVNMRHVEEAEANYKVREDIASQSWHYLYRHQGRDEKL